MEEIKITKNELRHLLFWAVAGFTCSNGGSGETKIPKIVEKYAKVSGFEPKHFPPMGIKSHAELTGDTAEQIKKVLKKIYPRADI